MRVNIRKILKMKIQGFVVTYTYGKEEKTFKVMTTGIKRARLEAKYLIDRMSKQSGKNYKVSCVAAE